MRNRNKKGKKYGDSLILFLVCLTLIIHTVSAGASDFSDFSGGPETEVLSGGLDEMIEEAAAPEVSEARADGGFFESDEEETPDSVIVEEPEEEGADMIQEESDFDAEEAKDPESDPDVRYIKGRPLTEEELAEQISLEKTSPDMLAPEEPEIEDSVSSVRRARAAGVPEKYDIRDSGWVTGVKNQGGGLGICWAFALASLMETSLLRQGLGTYDLSEEHLAYFLYHHVTNSLGNTPNDQTINEDGYHEGGNGVMGITHLTTWAGMTTEEDVPLPVSTAVVPDPSKAYHAVAYLKNANVSGYGVSRTKNLITAYGSVGTLLYYSKSYMAFDTGGYACPKGYDPANNDKTINHMVALVGWDDSYSYKNFPESSGITEDGAWIAKNSWGESWGDDGYFYISYQDASLSGMVTVEATLEKHYENNYFYDGTALNKYITLKSGESVANVFTAKAGDGKAEVLGEVSVFTYNDNARYSVKVYTNLTDASSPASGTLAATVTCQQSYAGIRTLPIPETTLLPGTAYAVVVTNTNPSGNLILAAECDLTYDWVYTKADIRYGQSYYSAENLAGWQDLAEFLPVSGGVPVCMRIKAHTRTTDQSPAITLSGTALTLEAGKKAELTATMAPKTFGGDLFTFSSSDPNVASVEGSGENAGTIVGRQAGTAVITCRSRLIPGLAAACTVTVSYLPPSGLTAEAVRYDRISLRWSASPTSTVSGYQIFRKSAGAQETCIATVPAGTDSYTDQALLTGTAYDYRIRAFVRDSGQELFYSAYTPYQSATPVLEGSVCRVIARKTLYNHVTWNKIPGADGYYVYRRLKGQNWKKITTITNAKTILYNDRGIKALSVYEYYVTAYREAAGKKVKNTYTISGSVTAAPARQKIKKLTTVAKGIKLTWTAQKKASGYHIYRRTKNGKWKQIAVISKPSKTAYTDKTARKNTVYYYAVKAYINEPYGEKLESLYTAKKGKRK